MPIDLPIDVKALDSKTLDAYAKHPEFITILDEWVLMPDYDLVKHFDAIAFAFNKIKPIHTAGVIYRGFSTSNYMQNNKFVDMDALKVDESVSFDLRGPMSFSEDISIAMEFGKNIITTKRKDVVKHCIYLSDELSFLINKERGIHDNPATQKEVLVLPSIKTLNVTALRKAPKWSGW
jgi:hypothetical protein